MPKTPVNEPFYLRSPGNRIIDPAYLLEDRTLKTAPLLEYKAPGAPKTWQDFLPEAEARLAAAKAKYGDGALAMAKQPRFGPRWQPRDITDPTNWTGCEAAARQIKKHIGGDIKRIVPKPEFEGLMLGEYRGTGPGWFHHEVVVKDGRVYDAFTGHEGLPIAEYKALWSSADALNFGF